jgi:hypothetical protein
MLLEKRLNVTTGRHGYRLLQPFSIFLPWRNPWNNFQVSGNPCIKIIISTAHGTLAWSVSCWYNNPIIIVNAFLRRELYFSVDLFISANKFKKRCLFFFQSRSLAEPLTTSRGTLGFRRTPVEKPWSTELHYTMWNVLRLLHYCLQYFDMDSFSINAGMCVHTHWPDK